MRFFQRIWRSVADVSVYNEVRKEKTSTAIFFMFRFLLLAGLLAGIILAVKLWMLIPIADKWAKDIGEKARTLYPHELTLTVKDGKLSTNVKEPYFVELPDEWWSKEKRGEAHFITIDTKGKIEDYVKYQTLVLFTQKFIVGRDNDGMRFVTLNEVKDITVDKEKVDKFLAIALPYLNLIPSLGRGLAISLLVLIPLFFGTFGLLWKIIAHLILSLILLIIASMMNKKFSYTEIFRMGMYAATLPIVYSIIAPYLGIQLWYATMLIFLGWMISVFYRLPSLPAATPTGLSQR